MHNQCLLHPYSVSLCYYFRVVCECERAGPLEINIVFTAAIHLIIPCPVLEVSIVFSVCVCVSGGPRMDGSGKYAQTKETMLCRPVRATINALAT